MLTQWEHSYIVDIEQLKSISEYRKKWVSYGVRTETERKYWIVRSHAAKWENGNLSDQTIITCVWRICCTLSFLISSLTLYTETGNRLNIYSIRILTRPPLNLGVGENANSNLEENYFQMKTFVCYCQQNIRLSQFQWIENVVILMKFSSLAALEVVKMKKFKSRQ